MTTLLAFWLALSVAHAEPEHAVKFTRLPFGTGKTTAQIIHVEPTPRTGCRIEADQIVCFENGERK